LILPRQRADFTNSLRINLDAPGHA
jgi:hypothetical protein